jgi:co-chaperonin GroES (HSP10)
MTNPSYTVPVNHVLVRPLEKVDGLVGGVSAKDFVDEHMSLSVWGEVVAIPEHLYFHRNRKAESYGQQMFMRMSLPWDTRLEVVPGDIICFEYMVTLQPEEMVDGMYLIPYNELLAKRIKRRKVIEIDEYASRVEDAGHVLYPLNGYLLIQVDDDKNEVAGIKLAIEDNPSMTMGLVVAEGRPNDAYMLPDGKETTESFVGKTVCYKKHKATRMEVEEYSSLDTKWSLYYTHRKNISLILEPDV